MPYRLYFGEGGIRVLLGGIKRQFHILLQDYVLHKIFQPLPPRATHKIVCTNPYHQKHKGHNICYVLCATERVGFEPTVSLTPHRLSRSAPSTTRTPLHLVKNTLSQTKIFLKIFIDTIQKTL